MELKWIIILLFSLIVVGVALLIRLFNTIPDNDDGDWPDDASEEEPYL